MFLYHHCLLPASLLNLFLTNNQIHSHDTRNANIYRPHSCRTNIKQFTVLYQGPKVCLHYHYLPQLKVLIVYVRFKTSLHCFLFNE